MPAEDEVNQLFEQAANVVASNAAVGDADPGPHARWLLEQVTTFHDHLSQVATYGLFPLCLALLILHEQHRASSEGTGFRIAAVAGRTLAVALAVFFLYGPLCHLLTTVFGGKGGWMTGNTLLGAFQHSGAGLSSAWDNLGGDGDGFAGIEQRLSALPHFLALVFIWAVTVLSAFFAYVAGLLLSTAQAVLIAIILACGKTCLTLSLVPGIGVGQSWAKALATVSAWSRIAGIITAMFVVGGSVAMAHTLAEADIMALLQIAAKYVILALCTLAVPAITSKVASGAVSSAPGAPGIIQTLYRSASTGVRSAFARNVTESRGPGQGGDRAGGGSTGFAGLSGDRNRPFKTERSALRQGLSVAGGLLLAPAALIARRLSRHEEPKVGSPAAVQKSGQADRNALRMQKGMAPVLPDGSPGEARAASNVDPEAFRQGEQVKQDLAVARNCGGGWASDVGGAQAPPSAQPPGPPRADSRAGDREAMNHVSKPLTDVDQRVLHAAHPDGWREGNQGRGDFAQARQVAQTYLQARNEAGPGGVSNPSVAPTAGAAHGRVARAHATPIRVRPEPPQNDGAGGPGRVSPPPLPTDALEQGAPLNRASHPNTVRRPLPLPPPLDEPPALRDEATDRDA